MLIYGYVPVGDDFILNDIFIIIAEFRSARSDRSASHHIW